MCKLYVLVCADVVSVTSDGSSSNLSMATKLGRVLNTNDITRASDQCW